MTSLSLDIHGVKVDVAGDAAALAGLARHFAWFVATAPSTRADVRVHLERARPLLGLPDGTIADQIVDRGLVFNVGATTIVDHHGHSVSRYDFADESGSVVATEVSDLVELGYLMVSSRVGSLLERHGLVRVHGVAVEVGGRGALVLAPSGGGKSTLARALLRIPEARLLGDDLALLDRRGSIFPFPTPIGLTDPDQARGLGEAVPFPRRLHTPKWILPLDAFRARVAPDSVPLTDVIVLARGVGPEVTLRRLGRRSVAGALARDAIVGLGLPQVLEFVARRGARDLPRLAPSAVRRTRAVAAVVLSARGHSLVAGEPSIAASRIVGLLSRRDG